MEAQGIKNFTMFLFFGSVCKTDFYEKVPHSLRNVVGVTFYNKYSRRPSIKKLGGKAKQKIDDGDVKVKEADGTKTKIDADRDVKIRWNFV
jgi:hypothetical protein